MSKPLEIKLEDIKEWLEQETLSILKPLKTEGTSLLNDVKSKMDDFWESCDKMMEDSEKEIEKNNPKTYRRAREAYKLARDVSEMMDRITVPEEVSHEGLRMLCDELEKFIATVMRERAEKFPRITPFFIIDRRRLDIALKRFMDSTQKLRAFSTHKYVKTKDVDDSFSIIDRLSETLKKLDEIEEDKKKVGWTRKVTEKEITELQKKITLAQSKGEVSELDQINKKIAELDEKAKYGLRHLQKPFFKFQTLARGPDYPIPPDELKKLDEYVSHPFEAFVTEEEGYPMLKRVLRKVNDAIEKGKLKLKSSRLRKAQEQIKEILEKDALASLHQSCKEALSQKQQLSTSEAITTFQTEFEQLEKELRELQKQMGLIESRNNALDDEHKKILERIESQKKKLESVAFELTNKKIEVILPQ